MTWNHGDESKQPEECKALGRSKMKCPNLIEMDPHNMNGETYNCKVCGEYFYLDYDEMR